MHAPTFLDFLRDLKDNNNAYTEDYNSTVSSEVDLSVLHNFYISSQFTAVVFWRGTLPVD